MIIDKVYPFWTEEERQKIEELRKKRARIDAALRLRWESEGEKFFDKDYLDSTEKNQKAAGEIVEAVERRYIESFRGRPRDILKDVREIVDAYEKQDYLDYIENWKIVLAPGRLIDLSQAKGFQHYKEENFEDCYNLIFSELRVQLEALAEYYKNPRDHKEAVEQIHAIIRRRISQWYNDPHPPYLPILHNSVTDAVSFVDPTDTTIDRISQEQILRYHGIRLIQENLGTLRANLSITTDKLLALIMEKYTNQHQPTIYLSVEEYAQRLGYETQEKEIDTAGLSPVEIKLAQDKEKKRAKAAKDNARNSLKKEANTLYGLSADGEVNVHGKRSILSRRRLFTGADFQRGTGHVIFTLSDQFAASLEEYNLIKQYPVALLQERNPTAYRIGLKLVSYYYIPRNREHGTYNRIGVLTLAEAASLPTIEEVNQKDRGHWRSRIKEPIDTALAALKADGLLYDYTYAHQRGIPLTDEELDALEQSWGYGEYKKLYIMFTLEKEADTEKKI